MRRGRTERTAEWIQRMRYPEQVVKIRGEWHAMARHVASRSEFIPHPSRDNAFGRYIAIHSIHVVLSSLNSVGCARLYNPLDCVSHCPSIPAISHNTVFVFIVRSCCFRLVRHIHLHRPTVTQSSQPQHRQDALSYLPNGQILWAGEHLALTYMV
jgi:hypothetical protein